MTQTPLYYQHKNTVHFLLKISTTYSLSSCKLQGHQDKDSGKKSHPWLFHCLLSPQCPPVFTRSTPPVIALKGPSLISILKIQWRAPALLFLRSQKYVAQISFSGRILCSQFLRRNIFLFCFYPIFLSAFCLFLTFLLSSSSSIGIYLDSFLTSLFFIHRCLKMQVIKSNCLSLNLSFTNFNYYPM